MPKLRLPLALCLLLTAISLPAQQMLKPQNIRFDGTQEYTPAELLAFTGIKKGAIYTTEYLSQSAQNLMGLGVFDKVAYKFDGIDLIYQLHDNPDLYAVSNGNLPIETGAELDAKLRQRVPLFHGKVPSEGSMLESVRAALQAMVAERGLQANVTSIPAGDSPYKKATAIKFNIESPAIKMGEVHIAGASQSMQEAIAKATRMGTADFDASRSAQFINDRIRTVYVRNGYPTAQVSLRSESPAVTDGIIRVPFTAQIVEGRAYKLGKIDVSASLPVPATQFDRILQSRAKFVPEGAMVEAYVSTAEHALKSKGYLDCAISAKPVLDDATGVVNYTIDGATGAQYHLGLLKFENASDELRARLMRNWQMMPGDVFDQNYVSDFLTSVQKNDPVLLRSLVGVKPLFNVQADPNTHDVNVVIRLER